MDERQLTRQEKRKLRTRAALKEATAVLLVEMGYEPLTIQHITDRADYARSTFYIHFDDKDDIIWSVLKESFDQLDQEMKKDVPGNSDQRRYFKWTLLFAYVDKNRDILKVILGDRGDIKLMRRLQDYMADIMQEDIETGHFDPITDLPVPFVTQYLAGAMVRTITWWLEDEAAARYTSQQMTDLLFAMILRQSQPPPS